MPKKTQGFQPNYYAIIPATVRYDKAITQLAKLLYGEISALANKEGFCWASNQYFAELYDIHPSTVSETINSLQKAGHVKIEVEQNYMRKIWILESPEPLRQKAKPLREKTIPPSGNSETPPSGKAEDNITSMNIKNNNSPSAPPKVDFIDTLIGDFATLYFQIKGIPYKSIKGKDRKAVSGILQYYKKIKRAPTTESTLHDMEALFTIVLKTKFRNPFLNEVTLAKINSNFNEYYQAIKSGSNNGNGNNAAGLNGSWARAPQNLRVYRKTDSGIGA